MSGTVGRPIVAYGLEARGPHRPGRVEPDRVIGENFSQYVLHRLDSIEACLRGEIKQLEGKVDAKIERMGARLDAKIEQTGAKLDDKIKQTGARLDDKIEQLGVRLNAKIDKLESRIDKLHGEIHWLIGIVIGGAGLAMAIVAWLSQAR